MNNKIKMWLKNVWNVRRRFIVALVLFVAAMSIYVSAGDYVTDITNKTVSSSDIILDHFGPYHLGFIFVWLYISVISIYFLYPLIWKPKKMPYIISMFSFLLIVRSGLIICTHLRPPADAIPVVFPSIFQTINWSNDLFFSGHVAFAFLGFLVYMYDNKFVKWFMLSSSIILGVVSLAMHVHYTIDVLSAFFIVYGVFEFGDKFLRYLKVKNKYKVFK